MTETKKLVLNSVATVVIALVLIRVLFMEAVVIRDNGMAPTLVYGDEVLVWKGASVDMADVVVCEHPVREGVLVAGRAIAFAGHTVSADHLGMLSVDDDRTTAQVEGSVRFYDVTLKRQWEMELGVIDYFGRHSHAFFRAQGVPFEMRPYRVESGVFLLGDNRTAYGNDSRSFGEVNPERCLGQVILRTKAAPPRNDELATGSLELIR